jgi:hypothetical protein
MLEGAILLANDADSFDSREARRWREERDRAEARRNHHPHVVIPPRPNGSGEHRAPPIGEPGKRPVAFKSVAKFCNEYVPLSYAIEGLVRSASLYTLTARTGDGIGSFARTGPRTRMALSP